MTTRTPLLASALLALGLLAAACGGSASSAEPVGDEPVGPPSAGMCAPGVTDCIDADLDPTTPCAAAGCDAAGATRPADGELLTEATAADHARALLGLPLAAASAMFAPWTEPSTAAS